MFFGLTPQAQQPSAPGSENPPIPAWPAEYHFPIAPVRMPWMIECSGTVRRTQSISVAELRTLPQDTQYRRIVSAAGWTYRSRWDGIPLQTIVQRVQPLPETQFIHMISPSGLIDSIPLQEALDQRALLCLAENGTPLSAQYGGPVRLMLFHLFSYKSVGQVSALVFSTEPCESGWSRRGYDPAGIITPGEYYAIDHGCMRGVHQAGEVTDY